MNKRQTTEGNGPAWGICTWDEYSLPRRPQQDRNTTQHRTDRLRGYSVFLDSTVHHLTLPDNTVGHELRHLLLFEDHSSWHAWCYVPQNSHLSQFTLTHFLYSLAH